MSIYIRQESLALKIPHCAMVVGIGGVGSWVALNLALSGVKKLIMIDHDSVEESNLNRTPFRKQDIGKPKVLGMTELILERRDISVYPLQKRVEEYNPLETPRPDAVMDCRDITTPLPDSLQKKVRIIGGYDGMKITLHVNPKPESIWGDEPVRYQTVPSWLVPPQLISSLITRY